MVEEEEVVVVARAPPDASPLSSLTFRSGMQREGETRGRRIVDNDGQRGHSAKRARSLPSLVATCRPLPSCSARAARPLPPSVLAAAGVALHRAERRNGRGGGQNRLLMIII